MVTESTYNLNFGDDVALNIDKYTNYDQKSLRIDSYGSLRLTNVKEGTHKNFWGTGMQGDVRWNYSGDNHWTGSVAFKEAKIDSHHGPILYNITPLKMNKDDLQNFVGRELIIYVKNVEDDDHFDKLGQFEFVRVKELIYDASNNIYSYKIDGFTKTFSTYTINQGFPVFEYKSFTMAKKSRYIRKNDYCYVINYSQENMTDRVRNFNESILCIKATESITIESGAYLYNGQGYIKRDGNRCVEGPWGINRKFDWGDKITEDPGCQNKHGVPNLFYNGNDGDAYKKYIDRYGYDITDLYKNCPLYPTEHNNVISNSDYWRNGGGIIIFHAPVIKIKQDALIDVTGYINRKDGNTWGLPGGNIIISCDKLIIESKKDDDSVKPVFRICAGKDMTSGAIQFSFNTLTINGTDYSYDDVENDKNIVSQLVINNDNHGGRDKNRVILLNTIQTVGEFCDNDKVYKAYPGEGVMIIDMKDWTKIYDIDLDAEYLQYGNIYLLFSKDNGDSWFKIKDDYTTEGKTLDKIQEGNTVQDFKVLMQDMTMLNHVLLVKNSNRMLQVAFGLKTNDTAFTPKLKNINILYENTFYAKPPIKILPYDGAEFDSEYVDFVWMQPDEINGNVHNRLEWSTSPIVDIYSKKINDYDVSKDINTKNVTYPMEGYNGGHIPKESVYFVKYNSVTEHLDIFIEDNKIKYNGGDIFKYKSNNYIANNCNLYYDKTFLIKDLSTIPQEDKLLVLTDFFDKDSVGENYVKNIDDKFKVVADGSSTWIHPIQNKRIGTTKGRFFGIKEKSNTIKDFKNKTFHIKLSLDKNHWNSNTSLFMAGYCKDGFKDWTKYFQIYENDDGSTSKYSKALTKNGDRHRLLIQYYRYYNTHFNDINLTYRFTETDVDVFINGIRYITYELNNNTENTSNDRTLFIGINNSGNRNSYKGIYEIAMWDTALTDSEVATISDAGPKRIMFDAINNEFSIVKNSEYYDYINCNVFNTWRSNGYNLTYCDYYTRTSDKIQVGYMHGDVILKNKVTDKSVAVLNSNCNYVLNGQKVEFYKSFLSGRNSFINCSDPNIFNNKYNYLQTKYKSYRKNFKGKVLLKYNNVDSTSNLTGSVLFGTGFYDININDNYSPEWGGGRGHCFTAAIYINEREKALNIRLCMLYDHYHNRSDCRKISIKDIVDGAIYEVEVEALSYRDYVIRVWSDIDERYMEKQDVMKIHRNDTIFGYGYLDDYSNTDNKGKDKNDGIFYQSYYTNDDLNKLIESGGIVYKAYKHFEIIDAAIYDKSVEDDPELKIYNDKMNILWQPPIYNFKHLDKIFMKYSEEASNNIRFLFSFNNGESWFKFDVDDDNKWIETNYNDISTNGSTVEDIGKIISNHWLLKQEPGIVPIIAIYSDHSGSSNLYTINIENFEVEYNTPHRIDSWDEPGSYYDENIKFYFLNDDSWNPFIQPNVDDDNQNWVEFGKEEPNKVTYEEGHGSKPSTKLKKCYGYARVHMPKKGKYFWRVGTYAGFKE